MEGMPLRTEDKDRIHRCLSDMRFLKKAVEAVKLKYMTFNSSCSYAGVANMLEQYGVDTNDRAIAMAIKLPYLFAYENGVYMAGPMLQGAEWFNLYLNPIGFEMIEAEIPAAQVTEYLSHQKTAMLGLPIDGSGKHAVVYIGNKDGKLIFLNNKWEHTDAPEQILLTDAELMAQIGASAVIASLSPVSPREVVLRDRLIRSVKVIRQNLAEIRELCSNQETVGTLRSKVNTLFRPLLLDGITMLNLLGMTDLAQRFIEVQRQFLSVIRKESSVTVMLGDCICMDTLTAAAEEYIRIIQSVSF